MPANTLLTVLLTILVSSFDTVLGYKHVFNNADYPYTATTNNGNSFSPLWNPPDLPDSPGVVDLLETLSNGSGYGVQSLYFSNSEPMNFNTIIFTGVDYNNMRTSIEINGMTFQFNNGERIHMTGFNRQYICETDVGGLEVGFVRDG